MAPERQTVFASKKWTRFIIESPIMSVVGGNSGGMGADASEVEDDGSIESADLTCCCPGAVESVVDMLLWLEGRSSAGASRMPLPASDQKG